MRAELRTRARSRNTRGLTDLTPESVDRAFPLGLPAGFPPVDRL